ncbi:MAG: M48 family metallopeptidase, partial [Ketobacter sp.]
MPELTEEQFIELVKRSETEAEQNITRYKLKLALFAGLGYFVIFFLVTALLFLVGGTIGVAVFSSSLFLLLIKKKIIIVILIAIWTFLKALWIKFDTPQGHVLEREKYPNLFEELDSLTTTLNALTIHQVIIEDTLNAAVIQHPRFGLFGGNKNTLFLGIQLLLALSPAEMRSVLAHELGHLSGNHSRFSGWIYRVRLSWFRIMDAFENSDSFGAGLMRRFFNWYAPKFSAYSFALARTNEYEADQVAARLTSADTAAKALINVYAQAPYIDGEFWNTYFKQADDRPSPPIPPYEGLAQFLKQTPISRQRLLENIKQVMQEETHYADTHPALRDRVEAITHDAVLPDTFDVNAAESWLGTGYQDILTRFDRDWMARNEENWKNRYDYVETARRVLAKNRDVDPNTLNDDELWELSQYKDEFEGDDAALAVYQCYQQRHPDSVGAAYY